MARFFLGFVLSCMSFAGTAALYRCENTHGQVRYQDSPCAAQADIIKITRIPIQANKPTKKKNKKTNKAIKAQAKRLRTARKKERQQKKRLNKQALRQQKARKKQQYQCKVVTLKIAQTRSSLHLGKLSRKQKKTLQDRLALLMLKKAKVCQETT